MKKSIKLVLRPYQTNFCSFEFCQLDPAASALIMIKSISKNQQHPKTYLK